MKISFKNDYLEGCHPNILEALSKYNLSQQDGYGVDEYCENARQLLLEKAASPNSTVHFVSGGTQANLLVISALLKPFESVISVITGHIFDNECGAIEATGHKIYAVVSVDGKINPRAIQGALDAHGNQPHRLKPKMVYISNATEIGTVYSKTELKELFQFCRQNKLLLFMDGARLAQALEIEKSDLSLKDVAQYTDIFYMGGTKNGALIGEAIVINNLHLQEDFEYFIKQKGAMLAKGRLLGIQFQELFKGDLYFQLARHANKEAMRLKAAFEKAGCRFLADTFTNQLFPIVDNYKIDKLAEKFDFYVWKKIDEKHSAIRIITSWATKEENTDLLIAEINRL